MKRLMVALSAGALAAMLLWPSLAAASDEGARPAAPAEPTGPHIALTFASGAQLEGLRAVLAIECVNGRRILISVALDAPAAATRQSPSAWGTLCGADDGLLWKAAAAVRRRALERLSDLILPRKTH